MASEIVLDEHSTFQDLAEFAVDASFNDMVSNPSFVSMVQMKEPERETDA